MITSEFRDKIYQFINEEITVQQLEEWLVPRLSYLVKIPYSSEANAAAAIELGLAELSAGIRNIDEFRKYLRETLEENRFIQVFIDNPNPPITSSSNYSEQNKNYIGNELDGIIISR